MQSTNLLHEMIEIESAFCLEVIKVFHVAKGPMFFNCLVDGLD